MNELFKPPYLGVAYYPEDWDEQVMYEDIAMMKKAGIMILLLFSMLLAPSSSVSRVMAAGPAILIPILRIYSAIFSASAIRASRQISTPKRNRAIPRKFAGWSMRSTAIIFWRHSVP